MGLPLVPLFGPVPGGPELLVILGIAVLLFGANKIPKLARSSGQAMGEFRRGREDIEAEIHSAASDASDSATAEETDATDSVESA